MFFTVLWACKPFGVGYGKTASQAFTGASNNFELAIAVVVAAYGADSEQALAATVGPLVEVPVLLGLAYLLMWYRRRVAWDLDVDRPMAGKDPESALEPVGSVELVGTASAMHSKQGSAVFAN